MKRPLHPDGFEYARLPVGTPSRGALLEGTLPTGAPPGGALRAGTFRRGAFRRDVCLASLALVALLAFGGCKRDADGQLPEVSGEKIAAKRQAVQGFGLVSAYPDQDDDELALALEFSRPLVGSQEFDALIAVT